MAILKNWRKVKEGATFNGQRVDYISIDTANRFHLRQKTGGVLSTPETIAIIDKLEWDATMDETDKKNLSWLWQNLGG